ncbi:unnamed protein product [Rotaria magnacalcarata]|nr:unnamed protein product [Rotaria magnacalcarata]
MHYNIDKGNLVTSVQPVVTQYNSSLPSITHKSPPQVINNTIDSSPITPTYNQINTQSTPKEIPHSSTLVNVTPIITDSHPTMQQNSFINNNYLDKSEIDSPINKIDPSTNLSVYNCSNDETIIQDTITENNPPFQNGKPSPIISTVESAPPKPYGLRPRTKDHSKCTKCPGCI